MARLPIFQPIIDLSDSYMIWLKGCLGPGAGIAMLAKITMTRRQNLLSLLLMAGLLLTCPVRSFAESGSGSDGGGGNSGSGGGDDSGNDDGDSDDDDSSGKGSQGEARRALKEKKVVPLRDIVRVVSRKYPGDVLDARLRRTKSGFVYSLKILDAQGRVQRIAVDALTARILEAGSGP
jgi:hypothetical protein